MEGVAIEALPISGTCRDSCSHLNASALPRPPFLCGGDTTPGAFLSRMVTGREEQRVDGRLTLLCLPMPEGRCQSTHSNLGLA